MSSLFASNPRGPLPTIEWRSARRDPDTGRHASAFRRLAQLAGSADVQHRVLAAPQGPTPPTSASTEIMSRGEPPLKPPGTRAIPAHPPPALSRGTGIPPLWTRYGCPSWPSGSPSAWSRRITFLTFDLDLGGAKGARRPEHEERGTTYPRDRLGVRTRLRARAHAHRHVCAHISAACSLSACAACVRVGGRPKRGQTNVVSRGE